MSRRAVVAKTYKLYLGGAFARSESGRSDPATDHAGEHVGQRAARLAQGRPRRGQGRARRAGRLGGADRLQPRPGPLPLRRGARVARRRARARARSRSRTSRWPPRAPELGAAVDTLVHYAGWTDKLAAVMGGINPVAAPYLSLLRARADRRRRRARARRARPARAGPRGRAGAGGGQHRRRARLAPLAAARARPRRGRRRVRRARPARSTCSAGGSTSCSRRCAATATSTRSSTRPATPSAAATIDELAAETVKRVSRPGAGGEPDAHSLARLEALVELKTAWHPVGV